MFRSPAPEGWTGAHCDVLVDSDTGLKIVIYTAMSGTDDESKLNLARVGGITAPNGAEEQIPTY